MLYRRPAADYGQLTRRRVALIALAVGLLLASLLTDVMVGPAKLSVGEVASALFQPDEVAPAHRTILWSFRLPIALFALVIGAALGVAGAQMQTILNNPLASPYTLGVSAGACFGAALAMISGTSVVSLGSTLLVPLSAFIFAMLCSLAVYAVAHVKRGSTENIILSGVATAVPVQCRYRVSQVRSLGGSTGGHCVLDFRQSSGSHLAQTGDHLHSPGPDRADLRLPGPGN